MEEIKQTYHFWILFALFNLLAFLGMWVFLVRMEDGLVMEALLREEMLSTLITSLVTTGVIAFVAKLSTFRRSVVAASAIGGIPILLGAIGLFLDSSGYESIAYSIMIAWALIFWVLCGFFIFVLTSSRLGTVAIWVQVLAVIGIILSLMTYGYSDFTSARSLSSKSMSDQEAVLVCESIGDYKKRLNCWRQLVEARKPVTNICLYAAKHHYADCFHEGIEEVYATKRGPHENLLKICKDIGPQTKERYGIKDTDLSPPGEFEFDSQSVLYLVKICEYRLDNNR